METSLLFTSRCLVSIQFIRFSIKFRIPGTICLSVCNACQVALLFKDGKYVVNVYG